MIEPGKILRTAPNVKRIIAISDIHGNLDVFQELLEKCRYQPGTDGLVLVGDTIEKGPKNLETLRFVMRLAEEKNVFVLRGNCDFSYGFRPENLIDCYRGNWAGCSIHQEMAKLLGIPLPKKEQAVAPFLETLEMEFSEEFHFLKNLPVILETPRFYFAHAGLENEELEAQDPAFVSSVRNFPAKVKHCFSKLLVVGHYPSMQYRKGTFDCSPWYDRAHHTLSIDGGNIILSAGQINGALLDNETGEWSYEYADGLSERPSPADSRAASNALCIRWPENQVEVLEEGKDFFLCRLQSTGETATIPRNFLYADGSGTLCCSDFTSALLDVKKGDSIRVLQAFDDRLLAKKGSVLGWILLK